MSWDPVLVRTLAAVVDAGTLEQAARRLHVTPSAVSQRVKLLEQQSGHRLLVRSKPVRATTAGRAVLRHAQRLAVIEHDLRVELGVDPEGPTTLPVAVNADSLATWFLPRIAALTADEDVVLDLRTADEEQTAPLLEDGVVTAAVTARRDAVSGCRVRAIGAMEYVAVAAPSWLERWATASTQEAVHVGPRVDFDRHDALQRRWLAERYVGRPVEGPVHRVPSSGGFVRAVELGLGWGMLPQVQAAALVADGRVERLGDDTLLVELWWQHPTDSSGLLDRLTAAVLADDGALAPVTSRR